MKSIHLTQSDLSPVVEDDRERFLLLFNDPEVIRWSRPPEDLVSLFERYLENPHSFAVRERGNLIGTVSLFETSLTRAISSLVCYELTYSLMQSYRRKGIMGEAVSYLCDSYADGLKTDVLFAGCFSGNTVSRRILCSQGFQPVFIRYHETGSDIEPETIYYLSKM